MPPIIHCTRHGQGFHNVGAGAYTLRDPDLTPVGVEQAAILRETSFPDQSNISLVVASPLLRTLHTAFSIFKPALTSNGKCSPRILAMPDIQETSDDLCDIGSDVSALQALLDENNWPVDSSLVREGWNDKSLKSRYSPHSDAITLRAHDARLTLRRIVRELAERGDGDIHIAIVTHGSFLHFFTDDWEDAWRYPATGWRNCETRSYVFEIGLGEDEHEDKEARLVETIESRKARGKENLVFEGKRQPSLFRFAMEEWERQGLQRPDKVE